MKTIIPAGYRLTVNSWESDCDNHSIRIVEGLTRAKVSFLVDMCKMLSNEHPRNNQLSREYQGWDRRFSNIIYPTDDQIAILDAELREIKHKHSVNLDLDIAQIWDCLGEMGLAGVSLHLTRVCTSWKVDYLPMQLEIDDVTSAFL